MIRFPETATRERVMTAYNVVRFKVKSGQEEAFIKTNREEMQIFDGFQGGSLIKTGDRSYCFVGTWDKFDSIVAARPKMVTLLDKTRGMLEDLGNGLGVTDPVLGFTVFDFPASKQC